MSQTGQLEIPAGFEFEHSSVSMLQPASWDRCTTLGAGTAPFLLADPRNRNELLHLLRCAHRQNMRIFPLGKGSNLIGSDVLLPDTVFVRLAASGEFGSLEVRPGGLVYAGAACTLAKLVSFALEHSLGGASALCGIPGTLGGALAMNAGAMGASLSDFLVSADGIDLRSAPEFRTFAASELSLSYRSSPVIQSGVLVTGLTLRFHSVDPVQERERIAAECERRSHAPKGRSAGSVFRNPAPDLPAGRLLEDAGCKGLRHGAYQVSEAHANWIVKTEFGVPGRECDCCALVSEMIRNVQKRYYTALKPEVRFVNMTRKEECIAPLKVLVVKGGVSSEREVSLESGAAVANALREAGYDVREYDIRELQLTPEMSDWADVVFPVLHGGYGEDGRIQELFEKAGIRFVGSGSAACRLIMDKVASKKAMDANGIPNAKYAVLQSPSEQPPAGLKLPLIVKPPSEGSTFGITLVETPADWKKAMELVFQYGDSALVEEFFRGVETTVGIINGEALPVIEIRYGSKIYDYDAKYTHALGETEYLCPPRTIPEGLQRKIQEAAMKFYEISGAEEILRVDVLASLEDGSLCVLEGNSIPGCTANSLVPKAGRAAGIPFPKLCSMLVESAYKRS